MKDGTKQSAAKKAPTKKSATKKRAAKTSHAKTSAAKQSAVRIVGDAVAPLVPARGPVHVFLLGEAPGPRGADKSGVPFFGDAAGKHLYDALRALGAVTVPAKVDELPWDGAAFREAGLAPKAHGIALGNAFDRCPTDDGIAFRAPLRSEIASDENVARLTGELQRFMKRGLVGIVTMGRVATTTIDLVIKRAPEGLFDGLTRRAVVHPSARGLLSLLPHRGTGTKMRELQERWMTMCAQAVREAGFPE